VSGELSKVLAFFEVTIGSLSFGDSSLVGKKVGPRLGLNQE
jgi:hypothetical protein